MYKENTVKKELFSNISWDSQNYGPPAGNCPILPHLKPALCMCAYIGVCGCV